MIIRRARLRKLMSATMPHRLPRVSHKVTGNCTRRFAVRRKRLMALAYRYIYIHIHTHTHTLIYWYIKFSLIYVNRLERARSLSSRDKSNSRLYWA
jgi:hypothetical protein